VDLIDSGYSAWRRALVCGVQEYGENRGRSLLIAMYEPDSIDDAAELEVKKYWRRGELCSGVGAIVIRFKVGSDVEARCKFDPSGAPEWWEIRYLDGEDPINEDDIGWVDADE